MSSKKESSPLTTFCSLGQKDSETVIRSVCNHHKNKFTTEEVEAALFIADPIVSSRNGVLVVLADHNFYLQLALCVKAKTEIDTSKSIDFLEEEIFGGGNELITEGFEIVSEAVINNLVTNCKNSFLDN